MPFAIRGLLSQMEDVKRRMQGPLAPPPDAFQLPQNGAPSLPVAQGAPPMPAQPQADPFANIANANISDANDPTHGHRKGIRGGLLHALGADKVAPEVAALLTPDQINRVKPGIVGSLWNAINYGKGPQSVMQDRAQNMLKLTDQKTGRQKEMAKTDVLRRWAPVVMGARTADDRYEAEKAMMAEYATVVGPEAMGTIPNYLNAIKPDEAKTYAPQHVTWSTSSAVVDGVPSRIRTSNTGLVTDMAGNDIRKKNITPYSPPVQPSFNIPSGVVGEQGKPVVFNSKTGKYEEQSDLAVKPSQASGARGRAIAEVLPTITATVGKLRAFTDKDIDKLSATGVNLAGVANKTSDTYMGVAAAGLSNTLLTSSPDRQYAQMVRAIGDAVARANEVGILTNQDITRYESQVSFVSGDDAAMKRQKVKNAISWAEWLMRNKGNITAGGKPDKMPGESPAEYQQRTGGAKRPQW